MNCFWKNTALLSAGLVLILASCRKTPTGEIVPVPRDTQSRNYYVNLFAYNEMSYGYLWNKEKATELEKWGKNPFADPYESLKAAIHENDRWSQLTDDFESFVNSAAGTSKTTGMDFTFYGWDFKAGTVCAVVNYTSADSPARKAGLERGDVILAVNGTQLDIDNYVDITYDILWGAEPFDVTMLSGDELTLSPVDMYEEPVHCTKVFDTGEKKIGYLHYTAFTLASCETLCDCFSSFTKEGIDELILDLRYNGGGYVITENVLASILAPESAVREGKIFEKEIYNANLAKTFESNTTFKTEFKEDEDGIDLNIGRCRPGIERLYVIFGTGSASASEALITGLLPYMENTVLLGEQTHGKYCTGIMVGSDDFFESVKDDIGAARYDEAKRFASNWGLYMMIGRYADVNGNTPCMPDGFTPEIEVKDNPSEHIALGDPTEAMLAAALKEAGYSAPVKSAAATGIRSDRKLPVEVQGAPLFTPVRPARQVLLLTD